MTSPPPIPLYVPEEAPGGEAPVDDRPVLMVTRPRRRVLARLLDAVVLMTAVIACSAPLYTAPILLDSMASAWMLGGTFVVLGLTGLAMFLLRVGRIVWWGCTVGQRVMGLRVVQVEDGRRPTWGRAFKRWVLPRYGGHSFSPIVEFGLLFGGSMDGRFARNPVRQCAHDRHADTVVVLAQPPPAPVRTGGLTSLSKDGPVPDERHERRWRTRERRRRVLLGSLVVVPVVAAAVTLTVVLVMASMGPPFAVNTFYDDDLRFTNRYGDREETYQRTAATVHDGEDGCLDGATGDAARAVLRRYGCEGRISTAFSARYGIVVSSHVLKFPDVAAAKAAADVLEQDDLVFVPEREPEGAAIGSVGSQDRYVVVTTAAAPAQRLAKERAKNAYIMLHAPTLNVIVWM